MLICDDCSEIAYLDNDILVDVLNIWCIDREW